MLRTLIAVTFLAASLAAHAAPDAWMQTPYGQMLLRPFRHAPFPHASRVNGYTYGKTVFSADAHYSDSTVGLFIPAGYKPSDSVDFVVHFHGWSNHVSKVFDDYHLPEEMRNSGRNAILVVPQGPKDAQDSGGGKLELDAGAFATLMQEITQYLHDAGKTTTTRIGHITLTAHSGGYKITSAILDHGGLADHITDVLLFDASYGNLDGFANWAAASPSHRLISLFTEHLAAANVELMALLQQKAVPFRVVMEGDLKDADLRRRGVLFTHTTDLAHDDVIHKRAYYARFLRLGDLPASAVTEKG